MPLKCVPLLSGMWGSEGKEDLRAVYRRRKQDNWGQPVLDAAGREQWDVTGPLPLRRHQDWVKKGFEYITLADEESLAAAAKYLRSQGFDPNEYANQDRRTRSPWNPALYAEDAKSNREREADDLRVLVEQFGAEAVIAIKRRDNPAFELPADLRLMDVTDEPVDAPVKRGPGRPRKHPVEATI